MAHDRILMHTHDNVGRSAIVRMFRVLPGTTVLTVHSLQRIHFWLRERWSGRALLWIHLLLHRISCGRLVPRRASLYVSVTRIMSDLGADCVGCLMQQDNTIG
jgi:hypothetical protein